MTTGLLAHPLLDNLPATWLEEEKMRWLDHGLIEFEDYDLIPSESGLRECYLSTPDMWQPFSDKSTTAQSKISLVENRQLQLHSETNPSCLRDASLQACLSWHGSAWRWKQR